jgi:hypothetical protein
MTTKTLKISDTLHQQLRITAGQRCLPLQQMADLAIITGLASLLARKQAKAVNPIRYRKGEKV